MSFNVTLYRNANQGNALMGAYPNGDAPAAIGSDSTIFLTTARLSEINSRVTADSTIYDYMVGRCNQYLNAGPYNRWEYCCAYALAHIIQANTNFRDYGITLFNAEYNNTPASGGWVGGNLGGYTSRNGFRSGCIWAVMFFSWFKDELTTQNQTEVLDNFETWGQYWTNFVDTDPLYRLEDTDEVTSLAANLSMLAAVLEANGRPYGTTLKTWVDAFRANELYTGILDGYFAGGQWGEGRDYSMGTMRHMGELYLVSGENLSNALPDSYLVNLIDGIIHNTVAGFTDLHAYGEVQAMADYVDLSGSEGRFYDCMLWLAEAVSDTNAKAAANYWLSQITPPSSNSYTGIFRLMFESGNAGQSPTAQSKDTMWSASGTGFVSVRSDWTANATQYFGWSAPWFVDHQEPADALSFNLARKGVWLSKAAIGYGGESHQGTASNTLLIENATSDGSSSPTGRPVGNGILLYTHNSNDLAYHAWEAKDTYNMSGAYATNYADQVTRQVAFIKPDLMVVHDRTITDETQVADLVQYKAHGGGNYTRYVKQVQHFQVQPTLTSGYYVAADAGQEVRHKVIYPALINQTVVDESVLWAGASAANMPANQQKWHISTESQSLALDNEFISVLVTGDTGLVTTPTSEQTFAAGANAIGVLLEFAGSWEAIVFPKDPNTAMTSVSFDISGLINANPVNYSILGLSNAEYSISDTSGNVSITAGSGTTITSNVLEF